MSSDPLASWNDGAAKRAILDFVARVTREGTADYVPPGERFAVFDNDGTLWCEKPLPVQVDFVLRRLTEMTAKDPSLKERQPWKAAAEKDSRGRASDGAGDRSARAGSAAAAAVPVPPPSPPPHPRRTVTARHAIRRCGAVTDIRCSDSTKHQCGTRRSRSHRGS